MNGPWSVVLVVASVAFVLRAAGPALLGGREVPTRLADVIELLPPALLAAFVATGVFVSRSALVLDARAVGLAVAAGAVLARLPLPATLVLAASATALARLL
jgi:branched-subunit amino acid transport protein